MLHAFLPYQCKTTIRVDLLLYIAAPQAGRQHYQDGRYSQAEPLLCAAMSCLADGWETSTREAHLAFDVLLHRFACATRLGSQVLHVATVCSTRMRVLQVVAANLRSRLLQLHQQLDDSAASRRMVHTLLDLAEAAEQPSARLPLLRMALAANRAPSGDTTRHLDETAACVVCRLELLPLSHHATDAESPGRHLPCHRRRTRSQRRRACSVGAGPL